MQNEIRISTGIEGLDKTLDYLRPGDTVTWQMAGIGDFVFIATQLVTHIALTGRRIVYLRFGRHPEVVPTEALARRGANIRQYDLDPTVGFETFSVQVHRIISAEPEDAFFLFDCLSDLQKFWFSDAMVCNFFCLTAEFLRERKAIAYIPLRYERHTYETISRIRHATNVLLNIRTLQGRSYIHPVKVDGRRTPTMYFPLMVDGPHSRVLSSSAETYALFDIFTQTGERRDCWDSMFDSVEAGSAEPTDADGMALKENILRCLLGTEPQRLELCRKYFSVRDLMEIKKREIGTGCIGGKSVGMLLARNIIRDTDPELFARRIEPHDSYFIGADVFYTYAVQNNTWELRTKMEKPEDYIRLAPELQELLLNGKFSHNIKEQFRSMLEYFGQSPIIVRSSSILEDGIGNAFAGKYDSVFCPNQGTPEERYRDFENAVRTVYASTVSPDAIRYRADRNLLDRDEQMALLVMRVSGDCHGDYYYPPCGRRGPQPQPLCHGRPGQGGQQRHAAPGLRHGHPGRGPGGGRLRPLHPAGRSHRAAHGGLRGGVPLQPAQGGRDRPEAKPLYHRAPGEAGQARHAHRPRSVPGAGHGRRGPLPGVGALQRAGARYPELPEAAAPHGLCPGDEADHGPGGGDLPLPGGHRIRLQLHPRRGVPGEPAPVPHHPDPGPGPGGRHAQGAGLLLAHQGQLHGRQRLHPRAPCGLREGGALSGPAGAAQVPGGPADRRAERRPAGRARHSAGARPLGHHHALPGRAGGLCGDQPLRLHLRAGLPLPRAAAGAELRQPLLPGPGGVRHLLRRHLPGRGGLRV